MSEPEESPEELRDLYGEPVFVYPTIEVDGESFTVEVSVDCGLPYVNVQCRDFQDLLHRHTAHLPAIIEEIVRKSFELEPAERQKQLTYRQEEATERKTQPVVRDRPGYIYLLKSEIGMYKIGRTKHLNKRFPEFNTFLPFQVSLEHSFWAQDYVAAEKFLHWCFAEKRGRGEWFALTPEDVDWFCNLTDGSVDGLEILSPGELGTYSPDEQGSDK